jgi:hypothetical protein
LDEIAAFGDVFCCLHFVPCEHPNLNVCIGQCVLALMRSLMVSGT